MKVLKCEIVINEDGSYYLIESVYENSECTFNDKGECKDIEGLFNSIEETINMAKGE